MNEIQFADRYLGQYKQLKNKNGNELILKTCPFCNGGQHNDTDTFAINLDKHIYNCARGKCGESGTFKELAESRNEEADYFLEWLKDNKKEYTPKTKEYIPPKSKLLELTDNIITYFENRGIRKETLDKGNVKAVKWGNEFRIAFTFTENKKRVMTKVKLARERKIIDGKKEAKERAEPGGKHVLWNMDNVDTNMPVVITEGMVDALSLIESSVNNVVSIPSGTLDLTWIDNCYEWIKKVNKWIIYVDNDVAGDELKKKLIKKLGSTNVLVVDHELNDANDELKMYGVGYINKVIKNAKMPPVEGLLNISDIEMLDPEFMEKCLIGIKVIDKYCKGFIFPSFNIWSGKRQSGKSTLLGQTILPIIDQGYKVFSYSGELSVQHFKLWLYLQAAGEKHIKTFIDSTTGEYDYKVDPEVVNHIDKWLNNKVVLYDDNNANTEDEVLRLMDEAYKRYDCRIFNLDNLMTIEFKNKKDKYQAQSDFVNRIRKFAVEKNVIVNLVIHPNKSKEIDNDTVGGSGDNTNAAFNVFWVSRINSNDDLDGNNPIENALMDCQCRIDITKNRYYPYSGKVGGMKFDRKSRRFFPPDGWDLKMKWEEEFKIHNKMLLNKNYIKEGEKEIWD